MAPLAVSNSNQDRLTANNMNQALTVCLTAGHKPQTGLVETTENL